MDQCMDDTGNATTFSTLDANRSYCYVEVADGNRDRNAFTSPPGLISFFRILFGLNSALGTSQCPTGIILSPVTWQNKLVHLDDIVIYSATSDENLDHVGQFSTLLDDVGVALKLKSMSYELIG